MGPMKHDLAAMARRARNPRRRSITFRPIKPPGTLASDLFASSYNPVIQAWTEALTPLMAEYERTLASMTTDSPAEVGSILSAVEGDAGAVMVSLRVRLERWAARIEKWQRGRWRAAVLNATGVDLGTMLGAGDVRETLGAAIERNVGLVRSVSEQARTRIGEAVFRGLTQRRPAREVAAEIREAVAMSRRRALNIASDQTTTLAAQLNIERATEAGLEFYEWIHSGKAHPREEHLARDGKRYRYGEPAGDEPGFAIHCGCTGRAVLDLEGEF